ncbi:MAG: hypothetical protein OQK23_06350, partial [Rhodospirillales bacterium]|nr:hypothetical protein [Rhodospirillales bacterium]MCW8970862.1 hypothetical protein [Rhodospirillales bacterium]
KYNEAAWWYWTATLVCMIAGLAGWSYGFIGAAVVSSVNLFAYIVRDRSLVTFPVQVRGVYLAFVLFGLWPPGWWMFIPMTIGTVMVVLFDRCAIARVLIRMPWNKDADLVV